MGVGIQTASLSSASTAPMLVVPSSMSPIFSGVDVQPSAPWRTTDRRFLTSSSTLSTSWFLVIVAPAIEVDSVGSDSTPEEPDERAVGKGGWHTVYTRGARKNT